MGALQGSTILPRERLAEQVSAATYGTVLVLAAVPLIDVNDVKSGLGWELVTGIGLATWVAHLFAEVLGEQLRHDVSMLDFAAIRVSMFDGLPILLAAVAPAGVLGLGRLGVLDESVALWMAFAVAFAQLALVGAFVGRVLTGARRSLYALGTALIGILVVGIKLILGH
jgi:hypothetical protein